MRLWSLLLFGVWLGSESVEVRLIIMSHFFDVFVKLDNLLEMDVR